MQFNKEDWNKLLERLGRTGNKFEVSTLDAADTYIQELERKIKELTEEIEKLKEIK